jgi:glycosyltransferase involved in cell wall biosynthesis
MRINVIARTNGVGLDRDVDLTRSALRAAGMDVTVSHCRGISPLRRLLPQRPRFDANVFIERVFPRWLGTARRNLLIPNQERFPTRHLGRLKHIDAVLCKSRHAEQLFGHHAQTRYIGFTSSDRSSSGDEPDYEAYFHLAGRSTLKGTEALMATWARHPEWPTLTVIQRKENAPTSVPPNVRLITDYVAEDVLVRYLNQHGVHLCPSLSEGWGHYIVEAMSCRATVLTTDAPPMNEIIRPDYGVLVPFGRKEPRHLGTNFFVEPAALERALSDLIHAPGDHKRRLGCAARAWFEDNDARFRATFPAVVRELVSDPS